MNLEIDTIADTDREQVWRTLASEVTLAVNATLARHRPYLDAAGLTLAAYVLRQEVEAIFNDNL